MNGRDHKIERGHRLIGLIERAILEDIDLLSLRG